MGESERQVRARDNRSAVSRAPRTRAEPRPATPRDLATQPGPRTLISLQRLVGNRTVTSLIKGRHVGDLSPVQRQLAPGPYFVTTEGTLRNDDQDHTEIAKLPARGRVNVKDKGHRVSLFKAGWLSTNEHSWSTTPNGATGWLDDSKLGTLVQFLDNLFSAWTKPSIDDLEQIIRTATPNERKAAADDDAFLQRAKTALDEDTYLDLLPALGVHRMPTTGTLARTGEAGHVTAQFAETQIQTNLPLYVAQAMAAGRKIEGEVSVVGDADFQAAFERQWIRAAKQTKYVGKKAREVCNAFVEVNLTKRHIWIHRDMGGAGTLIHEGMHKYASDNIRNSQIAMCNAKKIEHGGTSRLDEGITEYFTRIVVGAIPGMAPRTSYENEWIVATKLAGKVGEQELAHAYYDGQFASLKANFGVGWDDFSENLEQIALKAPEGPAAWAWLVKNGYT